MKDNNSEKVRPEFSIKAAVDLIKDIGFGMALIVSSAVLIKEPFFDAKNAWLLSALFLIGFFIVVLSPIDFHTRYFGFHGSVAKRAFSFFVLFIIYFPTALALWCAVDYFSYIVHH